MLQYKIADGVNEKHQQQKGTQNNNNLNNTNDTSPNLNIDNSKKALNTLISKLSKSNSEEKNVNKKKHLDLKNHLAATTTITPTILNANKKYYINQSYQVINSNTNSSNKKKTSLHRSKSGSKGTSASLINSSTPLPGGNELKVNKYNPFNTLWDINNVSMSNIKNTSSNGANDKLNCTTTIPSGLSNTIKKSHNEFNKENCNNSISLTKSHINSNDNNSISINNNNNDNCNGHHSHRSNNNNSNININNNPSMGTSMSISNTNYSQEYISNIDYNNEKNIKELIKKFQIKDSIQQKEINKLKNANELLKSHIKSLENEFQKLLQFKEAETKYIAKLENELKIFRDKSKNPSPNHKHEGNKYSELTKQVQKLASEKLLLEELLKNTLLDNEITKAKKSEIYKNLHAHSASKNPNSVLIDNIAVNYNSCEKQQKHNQNQQNIGNKAKTNHYSLMNTQQIHTKPLEVTGTPNQLDVTLMNDLSKTSISPLKLKENIKDICKELYFDDYATDENENNKNNKQFTRDNSHIVTNLETTVIDNIFMDSQIADDDSEIFIYSKRVQVPQCMNVKEKLDLRLDLTKIYLQREKANQ